MARGCEATIIFEKIRNVCKLGPYTIVVGNQTGGFLSIPSNSAPKWIVPENSKFARSVLAQWKPYGFISLIKWQLLRAIYSLGLLNKIPGIARLGILEKNCTSATEGIFVVPIIYVGTPGPQQKAVVTLIEINTGNAVGVMKVALELGSITSIKNEALALNALQNANFSKAPKIIEFDEQRGISLQTVLPGKLAGSRFTGDMLECLLNMPKAGGATTFNTQRAQLEVDLENLEERYQPPQQALIKRALDNLKGDNKIDLIFAHGDFAPWNIKQRLGGCVLFDLEDAQPESVPLWDICHFYFIQSCLFDKPKLIEGMLVNELVILYLGQFNLSKGDAKQLMLLYILCTVLSGKQFNASDEYKVHLIDKIQTVLDI